MDAAPDLSLTRGERRGLALLLLLAFALRAAPPLLWPGLIAADEVYQTVEPAYRLLTGHGLVTWEFFYGVRSWIFPGVLAGIIQLAWSLGLGAKGAFLAVRLAMAGLSLPIVACAWGWGRRSVVPGASWLAGGLVALWPDSVLLAAHPLTEVAAAPLLIGGLFLAEARWGRIFWAPLLLAAAAVLRIQLAPAALLAWTWMIWPDRRARWRPAVLGALAPLAFAALLDRLTWGLPLQSLWANLLANWRYGVAADFGTAPWWAYLGWFADRWGAAFVPILVAAIAAIPRARLAAAAAVTILLAHMAVAHKEYRFVYPAIPLILILAGIGSARIARVIAKGRAPLVAAGVFWTAAASILAGSATYRALASDRAGVVMTSLDIATRPDVCGVAIWGLDWLDLAGEFALGADRPVFYPGGMTEFIDRSPGFNTVLFAAGQTLPGDWRILGCRAADLTAGGQICVAMRRGSCAPAAPLKPKLLLPPSLVGRPVPWSVRTLPGKIGRFE